MSYIKLVDVKKSYKMGEHIVSAADGITFEIEKGEFAVIIGPSGAGKTTVLNLLGGMDTLTSGEICVDGVMLQDFNAVQRTRYRKNDVGFVFQFYNLVPNVTALENVELASSKSGIEAAKKVLLDVGLEDKLNHFPAQLSGGEQQRVAIARALAKTPKLLLCDEPTGALDDQTGKRILKLLYNACKQSDTTVIVITHNQAIAPMADRVISLRNGKVASSFVNENPTSIEEIIW